MFVKAKRTSEAHGEPPSNGPLKAIEQGPLRKGPGGRAAGHVLMEKATEETSAAI